MSPIIMRRAVLRPPGKRTRPSRISRNEFTFGSFHQPPLAWPSGLMSSMWIASTSPASMPRTHIGPVSSRSRYASGLASAVVRMTGVRKLMVSTTNVSPRSTSATGSNT